MRASAAFEPEVRIGSCRRACANFGFAALWDSTCSPQSGAKNANGEMRVRGDLPGAAHDKPMTWISDTRNGARGVEVAKVHVGS
jgi:hypothetical protein